MVVWVPHGRNAPRVLVHSEWFRLEKNAIVVRRRRRLFPFFFIFFLLDSQTWWRCWSKELQWSSFCMVDTDAQSLQFRDVFNLRVAAWYLEQFVGWCCCRHGEEGRNSGGAHSLPTMISLRTGKEGRMRRGIITTPSAKGHIVLPHLRYIFIFSPLFLVTYTMSTWNLVNLRKWIFNS